MSDASAKPRCILFLAQGGQLDGAQRQLCQLIEALDRTQFQPLVILDRDGAMTELLKSTGVPVYVQRLRAWRLLRNAWGRIRDARRAMRRGKDAHAVLVHASDQWKNPYALYIARRLGAPSVVHVRGPMSQRDVRKHELDKADGVVAISKIYKDALSGMGIPAERICVAFDSVDCRRFWPDEAARAAFRGQYGLTGQVAIGVIGRVEPAKRILEFLEIAGMADQKTGRQAHYFLVGRVDSPGYQRQLEAACERLGLRGRVHFTGRCEDTSQLIPGLDMLATLTGGSVMFEAMACAKAVLSLRPAARENLNVIHDRTAWCVNSPAPEMAAEGLATLILDAPLRERLGEAAREWVGERLTPAKMARDTEALYHRLLGDSGK